MSAPPLELPPSHSTSGHQDGLGRRTLRFDREDGVILERLHVRPELAAFEAPLRERLERAVAFEDERFARVRAIERDPAGGLTVVSEFVAGNRVCDLLEAAAGLSAEDATSLSVDAALGFLLEILPALAALHSIAGFSHGAVGPDRTVLTPTGQVVLLDSIFGHTLERLHFNRRRLWSELRIAAPPAAGPTRFDIAADLGQASLTGVMIVVGRLLKDSEYPDGLNALVSEVVEIAQIRGSARFASGLHQFLQRTLPIPGRKPYASADEAATELRQLAREIGIERCRAALVAFVDDMNRTLAAIELSAASSAATGEIASAFEADEPIAAGDYDPAFEEDAIVASAEDEEPIAASAEEEEPIAASAEDENAISFELLEAFVSETPAEPIAAEEDAAPAIAYEPEPVAEPVIEFQPEFEPVEEPIEEPVFAAEAEAPAAVLALEAVPEELVAAQSEMSMAAAEENARALVGRDAVRELAVGRDIELVRERFAAEAERVPEPRIAFDESFPDPAVQHPSAAPLLELQQETAAWRAAFVALDQEEPVHVTPEPVAEPEPPAPSLRKRKRGTKADRDKLRSNAVVRPVPVFVPPPVVPMAPMTMAPPAQRMPTPLYVPQPVYAGGQQSTYGRSDSARQDPVAQAPPPPAMAPAAPATIGLRLKTELPSGYTPVAARESRREVRSGMTALPYVQRGAPSESASPFPWKPVAAAVVLILVGVGVGRAYWPDRKPSPARTVTVSTKLPAAAAAAVLAGGTGGSIVIATQPPGARVLLDGKPAGESPVTLDAVAPGRHTITFVTESGSVKKSVKVESGKTITLDVPVGSGWIAVFAPITLDISENGKAIGTAEQGRLMLSPGRHELTLSNREFGYSALQTIEVEPGEERSITVKPMGELNLNVTPGWAEVWIDGQNTDKTTPARLQVPLGTHEIVFKHPELGERRRTTVVTASTPVALSVDFTKPSL
jgi:PEGA domain-containing protein